MLEGWNDGMVEWWNDGMLGCWLHEASETFNTAESMDQAESLRHHNHGRSPWYQNIPEMIEHLQARKSGVWNEGRIADS
ncbi:MAG: hypothetical protein IPH20_13360 [Bacteroidales bacterium]|nr:hypothetical protein [Bacteroidales bacterium]